jgi:nickel transport protein
MPDRTLIKRDGWTKGILSLILFIYFILLAGGPASAHKAIIFAWVDGDTVYTESKFSGGRRVKGGEVMVYDLDGNQLLKGKTNSKGEFSFKVTKKTGMKIVLIAGMGHRGEWTIPLDEIQTVATGETGTAIPEETVEEKPKKQVRTAPVSGVSPDEIRMAVEKALDRKLKPVLKILAESKERGPSVTEILGGIGYILGLMGVAAYFHYRNKSARAENKKMDTSSQC